MSRMLRPADVVAKTGRSRVTIWRDIRNGTFPPPIELGPNAIGWPESEIENWLNSRTRRTYRNEANTDKEAT